MNFCKFFVFIETSQGELLAVLVVKFCSVLLCLPQLVDDYLSRVASVRGWINIRRIK